MRRPGAAAPAEALELASLIEDGRVAMVGPVRQELLSGLRERAQFERLRRHLQAFPDLALEAADYEEAAACFNRCRRKGMQGSNTDFLLCAIAVRRDLALFTTDADFGRFAEVLPLRLHAFGAGR